MADVDASRLAHWVSELVRIPSVNPLHDGPKLAAVAPPGERPLAEALAGWLADQGADWVELHDVVDGRPNVYGYFAGRSDKLAVLDVHTDTVTVENMIGDPFDGRIEDGQVWGRGRSGYQGVFGGDPHPVGGVVGIGPAPRAEPARGRLDQRGVGWSARRIRVSGIGPTPRGCGPTS